MGKGEQAAGIYYMPLTETEPACRNIMISLTMNAFDINQEIALSPTHSFLSSGQMWAVLAVLRLCLGVFGANPGFLLEQRHLRACSRSA